MTTIKSSVLECIGNTPLIKIERYKESISSKNNIYAKVEFFNPGGSVKDRVGLALLQDAYDKKIINKETTIIEPTSGNTGIGLAIACSILGNPLILTMPETMSEERKKLLAAYGAKLVLTPGNLGMQGAVDKANELLQTIENSYLPDQFNNPNNPLIHAKTTAKELLDTKLTIDYFIAGVGTGGTISGIGKVLKETFPNSKIIAVEPSDSPLLSKGIAGPHKIQGIGANFIPSILKQDCIDEIVTVGIEDCYTASRLLATSEGLLVGISSGAAMHVASTLLDTNKNIVVLLPDTGERYLSTELFK